MLLRTIGILAVCASARAFILPAGVADAVEGGVMPDLLALGVDPKERVINVPCPSCAFPYEWVRWTEKGSLEQEFYINSQSEDSLVLNFTVPGDRRQLFVNDHVLYPLPLSGLGHPRIQQVPSDGSLTYSPTGNSSPVPLTATKYGLQELAEQALTPAGDVLKTIRFSIRGIDDQEVRPDEVEVKFLRTSDGELLIVNISTIPAAEGIVFTDLEALPSPVFDGPGRDCGRLPAALCKLKGMLERLTTPHRAVGGCHGAARKMPGYLRPDIDGSMDDELSGHRGRPHHMRPHHGRHGHHGHHRHGHGRHLMRVFVRAFMAVLVPVTAGIAAGMVVSLMGLVVGRIIGFIWTRLVRRGRSSATCVEIPAEIVVEDGADKSLLAEMEAPPAYEDDVPTYEELDNKERR